MFVLAFDLSRLGDNGNTRHAPLEGVLSFNAVLDEQLPNPVTLLTHAVFENDVTVVKRIVAERRGQLDKAYAKGMKIIQLEVSQILNELSSEMNISLIIPVSQTLFFDQKLKSKYVSVTVF